MSPHCITRKDANYAPSFARKHLSIERRKRVKGSPEKKGLITGNPINQETIPPYTIEDTRRRKRKRTAKEILSAFFI